MKELIRDLVPPVIWRAASELVRRRDPNGSGPPFGFSGRFASYEEAAQSIDGVRLGYQAADVLSKTRARTNELLDPSQSGAPRDIDAKTFRLLSCLMRASEGTSEPIDVLDFGGALGIHFFKTRRWLGTDRLARWTVVELPRTAEEGNAHFAQDRLSFLSDIESAREAHVIVASSSVHYCPNPHDTLARLSKTSARWLYLDRTPLLSESDDVAVIQRVHPSYYDAIYPCSFLSEPKLRGCLARLGWSIVEQWTMEEESVTWDNRVIPYRGLLCHR